MPNDVLLQKLVAEKLERELDLSPRNIGVEVHHGVVKLVGFVKSETARKAALLAAQGVEGVQNVVLDIAISPALALGHFTSEPKAA